MELIQDIDEEEVTVHDLSEIRKTFCINCYQAFDNVMPILFTRTRRRALLWWHLHHCTAISRR